MTPSMDSLPRTPVRLSPSKLNTFANCGLHYKFQYVDHIPEPPTKDTVLGNIIHRGLELLYREPQWDRSSERLVAHMDQSIREHDEELNVAVYGLDGSQEWKLAICGEARLFAHRIFSIEDPTEIVCDTEGALEMETPHWILRGRYDRVDYYDDGTVGLVDYKSGKPPRKAQERDKLRALILYAGMWQLSHASKVRDVRLVYLRSTPKGHVPVVVTAPVDSTEVDGGFQRVDAMAEAIRRGMEAGFKPRPGILCHWCPYTDRCPEGADYVIQHPRRVK